MDNTEISPIAYTVETPRGKHPSLQLKRLSPAANHSPGRLTVSPWPLLYAALYTAAGHLSTEFSRLQWHFLTRGEINAEGDGTLHSFQMDLHNVPWEELVVQARNIIAGENKTE